VSGNGSQKGYFINQHANGDTDRGTFECTILDQRRCNHARRHLEIFGGTGALTGVSGAGTFGGRMTSPTEVETSWEGAYQLG